MLKVLPLEVSVWDVTYEKFVRRKSLASEDTPPQLTGPAPTETVGFAVVLVAPQPLTTPRTTKNSDAFSMRVTERPRSGALNTTIPPILKTLLCLRRARRVAASRPVVWSRVSQTAFGLLSRRPAGRKVPKKHLESYFKDTSNRPYRKRRRRDRLSGVSDSLADVSNGVALASDSDTHREKMFRPEQIAQNPGVSQPHHPNFRKTSGYFGRTQGENRRSFDLHIVNLANLLPWVAPYVF